MTRETTDRNQFTNKFQGEGKMKSASHMQHAFAMWRVAGKIPDILVHLTVVLVTIH